MGWPQLLASTFRGQPANTSGVTGDSGYWPSGNGKRVCQYNITTSRAINLISWCNIRTGICRQKNISSYSSMLLKNVGDAHSMRLEHVRRRCVFSLQPRPSRRSRTGLCLRFTFSRLAALMDTSLPDPTDWLETSLPSFATLESALRCQVCKDFYDTPMITSCSHTFCSLCIRRCLSSDSKCPTCRAGDQASKLRRNWAVQEVVEAFQNTRTTALELAKEQLDNVQKDRVSHKRNKRKASGTGFEDDGPSKRTRSSQAQTRSQVQKPSQEAIVIALDSEDDGNGDCWSEPGLCPEPDDGLVACPLCGRRMMEEAVFNHLDKCTGEEKSVENRKTKNAFHSREPTLQTPSKQAKTLMERLPQLNYTLLKDNALRKKLQELGIPTWGPRQLLIKRHTEWVDIYNSNSDCLRPRSVKDLLKDLDTWERSQGGLAQGSNSATGVMKKDFDHEDWKDRHKNHFNELIANARAPRSAPAKERGEASTEKEPSLQDNKMTIGNSILETTTELNDHHSPTTTSNDNTVSKDSKLKEVPSNDATSPASVTLSSTASEVRSSDTATYVESRSQQAPTHTPLLGGSPEKLNKIPMFQVPEDPIMDIGGRTEVK